VIANAPAAGLTPAEADGHAVCVLALVRAIETTRREERELQAEIGDVRSRFPDEESLAALAGVAPVTRASGKMTSVGFRWAADKKLRNALIDFADDSRHASPWAKHVYDQAIARGKRHPHAVRILARAWTRVIWRCWHDGVAYNPQQHGGATRLAAA
jgi:transposase